MSAKMTCNFTAIVVIILGVAYVMKFTKGISILLAATLFATTFYGCSKQPKETGSIDDEIVQIEDKDDSDTKVVTETEKSNLLILDDENENKITLIPVLDVKGTSVIAGLITAVKDKDGKEQTSSDLIGKAIALYVDSSTGDSINKILLKEEKKVFLKYYTDDKNLMNAIENAENSKLYEVTTTVSEAGNTHMKLTADKDGNPIEVIIKNDTLVDAKTGKTISKVKEGGKQNSNNSNTGTTSAKPNPGEKDPPKKDDDSKDKVTNIDFNDYKDLPSINVQLTKNTGVKASLADDSPVKVNLQEKVYVKGDTLYIRGNGDYYITQSSDCLNGIWSGRIVVELGDYGLARVRMAGVKVKSAKGTALEFIDTDTVINDNEAENETLIGYKPIEETKANPNAILTFVSGTNNEFSAEGNPTGNTGTIYSQCKLSIKGHGTANINSKNKSAIHCSRSLGIQNATLKLNASSGRGIRVKKLLDIEENANITIKSLGDAIRCTEFLMDTDIKDSKGNKDKSTGSTVNIFATSGGNSAMKGDGIDADDNVIVRAGKLNIEVVSAKAKYGIRVRRINNEEIMKIIRDEKITNIETYLKDNPDSPYFDEITDYGKEYKRLISEAKKDPGSNDYQGIRKGTGYTDTFRFTGGTTKVKVVYGRNSTIKDSANSQPSISAYANVQRGINIVGQYSSNGELVRALLYSSENLSSSKTYTVTFEQNGKFVKEKKIDVNFKDIKGNVGIVSDAN